MAFKVQHKGELANKVFLPTNQPYFQSCSRVTTYQYFFKSSITLRYDIPGFETRSYWQKRHHIGRKDQYV